MNKPLDALNVPPYYDRPQRFMEIWRLSKAGHTAVCSAWTHSYGGELRVEIDGEMHKTEAGRDGQALLRVALDWQDQFVAKGWT
jgi:hypothetical protein